MPQIQLSVSEAVEITFKETDGLITVAYRDSAIPSLAGCAYERAKDTPEGISIHCDLPDRLGREGIVYHEPFGPVLDADEPVKPPKPADPEAFSIERSRHLASCIFELFRLDQTPTPELMSNIRDQLMAAANLVDGVITRASQNNSRRPTEGMTLSDVLQTLINGKF